MGKLEMRRLEALLRACFDDLGEYVTDAGAEHFTCFRGDSWQFVVCEAPYAVDAAVCFRASLLVRGHDEFGKRMNSAIAIGFGTVDFFPDDESSAGGGQAYELSGKRLDRMRRRVPGMIASGLGPMDPCISAILGLVDTMIRRWTPSQASAVRYAIHGLTQVEAAALWKPGAISQQAVHKHLQSAGWPSVGPALEHLRTTIRACIVGNNHVGRADSGRLS